MFENKCKFNIFTFLCLKFKFREYYFSADNLQKDFFLRRKMDNEGFLPVTLIAGFPRVRTLSLDIILITNSLKDSDKVELSSDELKVNCKFRKIL